MKTQSYKIAAVIVTYNRLDLLKECINAVKNETKKLDEIIVVNNSSTDGTLEWLNEQKGITIITQENSGSAGGQFTGIKAAYEKGFDWIWCLDQDIVPNKDALECFLNSPESSAPDIGFLSSIISVPSGELAYINIPYIFDIYDVLTAINKGLNIPIISSSFGSVMIAKHSIEKVGYPLKEFFIWGDDVEYTMRMIKKGLKGFLIIKSKGIHNTPFNYKNPFLYMSTKDYKTKYAVRNTIYTIRLRNKVVYNSYTRGIFSSLKFSLDLVINKFKFPESQNILAVLKTILYSIQGLFFNPKMNK